MKVLRHESVEFYQSVGGMNKLLIGMVFDFPDIGEKTTLCGVEYQKAGTYDGIIGCGSRAVTHLKETLGPALLDC